MATDEAPKLQFKEILTDVGKPTLILLHGLFSSPAEYMDVCCYLSDFNLILVDQAGHSESKDVPFTLDNATTGLHQIIGQKDLVGKVHVVGLSLGGFVALEYARRYPGVAKSIFSTGATPFVGWQKWMAERPRIVYPLMRTFVSNMPDSIYNWVCKQSGIRRHDDLRAESKKNTTFENVRDGFGACLEVRMEGFKDIEQTRVMLVAGGKNDDVEATRAMGVCIREKCPGSRAFVVRDAVHAWDLQFPQLFADGVRAWVEGREELPSMYEELL